MTDRILIRGGTLLTQDDSLGEMAGADVLVEGDRIAEVGRGLSADGARVIEADGDIVIPGFVDTHRHTWETSIRTSAPDYTLGAYFGAILDKFAPKYRPEDVYAGNLWGSLECLNAGITTLVDWSHIMNTPEHADEAVRGLQESGIRSVFAFGFPNTSIQAWWFGMDYAGSTERINGDEARRVRSQYLSDDQGLITMALATRGTNFCKEDVVRYEWELAKELGINITVHVAMDRFGYTKMQLRGLKEMDLLYPNTTYIHSSHLLDDEWQMVARLGRQCVARTADRAADGTRVGSRRHRHEDRASRWACRPTWRRRLPRTSSRRCTRSSRRSGRAGIRSLGTRTSTATSRHPDLIDSRQVLRWATIDGARVAGVADRAGSITPGKKADLVIIDTKAVNVAPVIDPVGAVVCAADISNVRTVLVDGRVVKDDFKLLASLDAPRRAVEASRDYLVGEFGEPEPGWMVKETAAT